MPAPANQLPPVVLVIDDEPDLRTLYELTMLREGYRVEAAGTLAQARQMLEEARYNAVITDMRLPDGLGLELLQGMNAQLRPERFIVITAYGSAENAVEALKSGAFDYLTKPVDLKQLRIVVASAIHDSRSVASNEKRPENPRGQPTVQGTSQDSEAYDPSGAAGLAAIRRLVGDSEALRSVKRRVAKVAHSMAPVMVRGESGTGKELVAQAIHACSHRSEGPFVAVNCGAIPENLLEAEFFGSKKGSYTGSTHDREGYFHAARGGTLFLDEIGDLPLPMQSKLLRSIQERRIRPLGSTQEDVVDVRIVSATHKDLVREVNSGSFRQDLYYRLNVIEIVVPPLRERREDLPALCDALLERIARESGTIAPVMSPDALRLLLCHPLQGNVRELENLLHRALALGTGGELHLDDPDMPADLPALAPQETSSPLTGEVIPEDLQSWLDEQERAIITRALNNTGFNRTAAAAQLGLNLRQMRYRMSRLAIIAPSTGGDTDDLA
jgi:two-component system response regulator PilR (NtrC family)